MTFTQPEVVAVAVFNEARRCVIVKHATAGHGELHVRPGDYAVPSSFCSAISITFTRAVVCARPSNQAVGGVVLATTIACAPPVRAGPDGSEGSSRNRRDVHNPGQRAVTGRLGAAPVGNRRTESLRFDGTAERGRRGVRDLSLGGLHGHSVDTDHRARLGVRVGNGPFHRIDVHAGPPWGGSEIRRPFFEATIKKTRFPRDARAIGGGGFFFGFAFSNPREREEEKKQGAFF